MATTPTPQGIVPSDESVKLFADILGKAYTDVYSTLQNEDITDRNRRIAILNQIKEVAAEADENVKAWIQTQVPAFYEGGMFETTKAIHERGSEINLDNNFAHFHVEAIDAIAKETYASIADGMLGITRTAEQLIAQGQRQAILEGIGKGIVTGDTRKEVSKDIISKLKASGITALRDKGGREWDLIRYAEMLARTKLTQAHNTGVANRLAETGYDLVIVSNHYGTCSRCAPHEGQVYSVKGSSRIYGSLDQAISDGLFHPNCRHQISPYHSAYLDNAVIWDSDGQEYVPYKEFKLSQTRPVVVVTRNDAQRTGQLVINNEPIRLTAIETRLVEKNDLTINTKRGMEKSTYGSYSPALRQININAKAITRDGANIKDTFYHELGHFVDYTYYTDPKAKFFNSTRITKSTEWRTIPIDEKQSIIVERIKRMTDDENTAKQLESIVKTGYRTDGRVPARGLSDYATYLTSNSEVFADGYTQYRNDTNNFKKRAPELYKLFTKIRLDYEH